MQFEHNNYEEPHKKDDHACDSLRYMIMTRPDLNADNPSFSDDVEDVMRKLSMGVVGSAEDFDIADPNGRRSRGWVEGNSYPVGNAGEWVYDEHMGGLM